MNNFGNIFFNVILITIFTVLCCYCIGQGINRKLLKEFKNQQKLNEQLLGLFQNEQSKTDILYKVIFHIRNQLSLLKLKDCPEEEFKNIPFEIIDWINTLEELNNGDEDGIHK